MNYVMHRKTRLAGVEARNRKERDVFKDLGKKKKKS